MEETKDIIQDLILIYRLEQKVDYKNTAYLKKMVAMIQQKHPFKSSLGQKYYKEIVSLAEGKGISNQCVACGGKRNSQKMLCSSCVGKMEAAQTKKSPTKKNSVAIALFLLLISVMVFEFYMEQAPPKKAIEKVFVACAEGDAAAVQKGFNGTEEKTTELVKVVQGMILTGDKVVDIEILEEEYTADDKQVRVDCLFTVQDQAGKQWPYRAYFYLSKSFIGWKICDIRNYNDVSVNEE